MKPFMIILVFLLSFSCRGNHRSNLSKKHQRFVLLYVELLQLKNNDFASQKAYMDSSVAILHKYQYTQEEYDQTLAYFNKKPKRWEVFYEEVLEQLKRNNASSQQKKHP